MIILPTNTPQQGDVTHSAAEGDNSTTAQVQHTHEAECGTAERLILKERRAQTKASAREKAGLDPKQFRSKLKELRLLLFDASEAQLLSHLTADQLAELCGDTAAVARRMVELKIQAPRADLAFMLRYWPIMLTKEHRGSFLLGHDQQVLCVAVSADGRLAVTGSCDATARVWDLNTCACLAVLEGHTDRVLAVAMTGDGRAVSLDLGGTLRVWDLDTYACTAAVDTASRYARALAVTPDGKHAVAAAGGSWLYRSTVGVWSLEPPATRVATLEGHAHVIECVAVSHDGRYAASGSSDASVRLWDLHSMTCTQVWYGNGCMVTCVAFTPDGRHIVSGGHDKKLRVWCVSTGARVAVLKGHTRQVLDVAVAADGRHVVSVEYGRSASVRVWSLDTLACVSTTGLAAPEPTSLAILPDGRVLVAGPCRSSLVQIMRLPGLS